MKKLATLSIVLSLILAATSGTALAGDPHVTDLVAGQNLLVGTVTVDNDGSNLTVAFEITDPDWYITKTHLYVGDEPPARLAPGRYPYNHADLNTQFDSYTVPLSDLGAAVGDELAIVAHANVQMLIGYDADLDAFNNAIPTDPVDIVVAYPGGDSYFNTTISFAGELDGTYDGFCVDTSRTISPGAHYCAFMTSSYDPLAVALVDHPENLDLVNYLINQDWFGQTSPSGGTYTLGDIQRAIWTLIDDTNSTAGLGSWSQARVDELVADALFNGEGFVPGCDDVVAVILNPVACENGDTTTNQVTIAQITFAEAGVPCTPLYQKHTAWAYGANSLNRAWGWYLTYTVQ